MVMKNRSVEVMAELADGNKKKRKQRNRKQRSKMTRSVTESKLIARMEIERKYLQRWRGMDGESR